MQSVSAWFISHTAKFSFGIQSPSFGRYIHPQLCFLCRQMCLYFYCSCDKIQGSLREEEVTMADSLRMGNLGGKRLRQLVTSCVQPGDRYGWMLTLSSFCAVQDPVSGS